MENWKRTFAFIWTGQFLSILTSVTVNFAIILWITFQTDSGRMLAYAAIAGILPQALLSPLSGVFIDRWNRKITMILADSFIALCTLILAILFWLGVAEIWHIFILLALRSVGSAFHSPAMQASVPLLAPREELSRIAGISQIIISVCNIAGPALGALLIVNLKIEYILILDIVGAALACILLLLVIIPNPEKTVGKARNIFREMKEGVTAVLQNKGLSWVFLFSILVTFFLIPASILSPLMTTQHFAGNEFQVSLIGVSWGGGALIGGVVMGVKVYKINKVILVNCMYILAGLTFLLSGLLPETDFMWFAILTAFGGISGAVYNSCFTAIVQTNIEPGTLGRVFSMLSSLGLTPSMVGIVGIGFFADNLGVANSFIVCGSIIILIGFFSFTIRSTFSVGSRPLPDNKR